MNKAILLAAVNIIRPIDIIWGDAMIQMAAGAVQEDDLSKLSWKHHFYRPIDNFRFFDIGIYDIDNAPERAHVFWSRMIKQLVDDPFGYYPDGGWNYVGRISHLLQDMSSPSHALAKSHAKIDYSCKYEQWYKEYGQEYIKSTRL